MKNVFYFHLKLTDLYGQPNIFIPPDFLLVSSTSETHLESEIHLDNLREFTLSCSASVIYEHVHDI